MCFTKIQTKLSDVYGLANELPFFSLEQGELQLASSVGPVADVHGHLALTYGRHSSVDLHAQHDKSFTYLPADKPLDLDKYMNQNFDSDDMRNMRLELSIKSLVGGSMRCTHTGPNLKRSMAQLNIQKTTILAIDGPLLSWNSDEYAAVSEKHKELALGASIHPRRKNKRKLVEKAVEQGAVCMKMHPAVQGIRPDHPKAMELYELCGEYNLPVFWHGGPVGIVSRAADERCQLKHYWHAVHNLPNTTFVLGHSGALQYDMGMHLASHYDNCYLEISCQALSAVADIIKKVPSEKIMNGSDWPFYHQAVSIAKVLIATEKDEVARHNILWQTANRLLYKTGQHEDTSSAAN